EMDRDVPRDARGAIRPPRRVSRAHQRRWVMRGMGERALITAPGEREVRIERTFDAPRELVWRAFTDPTLIAEWWARGKSMVVERMEVKPGGRWRFVMPTPKGPNGFGGAYREVVAPEKIVWTFEWDGMPGYVALETVEFIDLGDGRTQLVN